MNGYLAFLIPLSIFLFVVIAIEIYTLEKDILSIKKEIEKLKNK